MVEPEEVSADLTNSKSRIKSKLIEESQNDHHKKYSVLEDHKMIASRSLDILLFTI